MNDKEQRLWHIVVQASNSLGFQYVTKAETTVPSFCTDNPDLTAEFRGVGKFKSGTKVILIAFVEE
jgi:hypothetical protein